MLTRIPNSGLVFKAYSETPFANNFLYIRYFPTLILLLFVAAYFWAYGLRGSRGERLGFSLIVAAACSNLIDHWRSMFVTDTMKVLIAAPHKYLPFNLADLSISVGLVILLSSMVITRLKPSLSVAKTLEQ